MKMETAATVFIYTLAATIVTGLMVFTVVGLSILRTLMEADTKRKRIDEKIDRGARQTGGRP